VGIQDAIDWTPELELSVLSAIEGGSTLRQTAENNHISASAIIRRARESDEFAKQYARVLELRTDADFESLEDVVSEEPERGKFGVDSAWVNWRKLQIDTRKWALSKRNPKKYGDLTKLSGPNGDEPVALTIVSSVPRPERE
jgi:terminase small subunit-like protein